MCLRWIVMYLILLALGVPSAALAQLQPTTARPSWLTERAAERGSEAAVEPGGSWRPSRSEVGERPTLRVWAPPPLPPGPRTEPPPGGWRPPSDVPTLVSPGWTGPQQRVTSWSASQRSSPTGAGWGGSQGSGSADSLGGGDGPRESWRDRLGARAAALVQPGCPDGQCAIRAAAEGLGSAQRGAAQFGAARAPCCGSNAAVGITAGRGGGDAVYTESQHSMEAATGRWTGEPINMGEAMRARSAARWGAVRSACFNMCGPKTGNGSNDSGAGGAP